MSKVVNFNTLVAGQVFDMSVFNDTERCTFLGFTDISEKHSLKPVFNTLRECKKHFNVTTNKALESVGDHLEYGHHVYAILESVESNLDGDRTYVWGAYLFKGKWSAGSSADPITFPIS